MGAHLDSRFFEHKRKGFYLVQHVKYFCTLTEYLTPPSQRRIQILWHLKLIQFGGPSLSKKKKKKSKITSPKLDIWFWKCLYKGRALSLSFISLMGNWLLSPAGDSHCVFSHSLMKNMHLICLQKNHYNYFMGDL